MAVECSSPGMFDIYHMVRQGSGSCEGNWQMQSAILIMYQERLLSTRPTAAGIDLVPLAEPLLPPL